MYQLTKQEQFKQKIKNEGITVLSLFDGMSCGQIALDRIGIKVHTYYAAEIETSSIKITNKNYPNTVQLGDVTKLTKQQLLELGSIDLLIGGSPCTNLSRTVINNSNHNQGLDGVKSKLFYDYLRVLEIVKPTYFMLENVESMSNNDKEIITECMKVNPVMIDSADFSAQSRKRYYWTNLPVELDYCKSDLVLKDIVLAASKVDKKYWYDKPFTFNGDDKKVIATIHINGHDILKRVNNINHKSATLTAVSGGNQQKKVFQDNRCRKLTPLEYERLQTVPEGYTEGVSDTSRYTMLGNGWNVDTICHIFSFLK